MSRKTVSIQLDVYNKAKQEAEKQNMSLCSFIAKAINEHILLNNLVAESKEQ